MSVPKIYSYLPFVNSEASLIIGICAFLISTVAFCGGIGVHFFGLDITQMAYISFWVFDISVFTMLIMPWVKLPALSQHTNYQRLQFMVEIWIWL